MNFLFPANSITLATLVDTGCFPRFQHERLIENNSQRFFFLCPIAVNCLTASTRWLRVPHKPSICHRARATTRGTARRTNDRRSSSPKTTFSLWRSSANSAATAATINQSTIRWTMPRQTKPPPSPASRARCRSLKTPTTSEWTSCRFRNLFFIFMLCWAEKIIKKHFHQQKPHRIGGRGDDAEAIWIDHGAAHEIEGRFEAIVSEVSATVCSHSGFLGYFFAVNKTTLMTVSDAGAICFLSLARLRAELLFGFFQSRVYRKLWFSTLP